MYKIILLTLIAIFCFLSFSCSKPPLEPESRTIFSNRMFISCLDTIIKSQLYYKVSFSKDSATWNPEELSKPIIYQFSQKFGNNTNQDIFKKIEIPNESSSDSLRFYKNDKNAIDSLTVLHNNFVFIRMDSSDFSNLSFSITAITNLSSDISKTIFSNGILGDMSSTIAPKRNLPYLSINKGAIYTASDQVNVSIILDTSKIRFIVVYRYSAYKPIKSIDSIPLYSNGAKQVTRDTIIDNKRSRYYNFVSKPDTIQCDTLNRSFNKVTPLSDNHSLSLEDSVRLLPEHGTKYVVLQRLGVDKKQIGPLLYDYIDIQPYRISVGVDLTESSRFRRDHSLLNIEQVCVLSKDIPVFVETYGDTTFEDSIYLWIATRKTFNSFFKLQTATEPIIDDFSNNYIDSKWPDCILETPPERFHLNPSSKLYASLLTQFDYETGYHVSPLGQVTQVGNALNLNSFSFEKINVPSAIKLLGKTNICYFSNFASYLIKPGSCFGYALDSLDNFSNQKILGNDTLNNISVLDTMSPGWHTVISYKELQSAGSLSAFLNAKYGASKAIRPHSKSVLADLCVDLDRNFYKHPFRGLPLTSSKISTTGTKEFVIFMFGRGKYFKEPRVAISKQDSLHVYVWDAIPPQFVWSIFERNQSAKWDPTFDKEYAPLCYIDSVNSAIDRCSDISFLPGFFDVYLSSLSGYKAETSLRDMGFGKIVSAKLVFNFNQNYLKSNPITGERYYLTPNIEFPLSDDAINDQARKTFYTSDNKIAGTSYCLTNIAFRDIDFSGWQTGLWDMWIETEDDLGNRGLAPHGIPSTSGTPANQFISVRKIEIK